MQTFLSHLKFWQDVLEHCKSQDVNETLLDHFQVLFLEQLLYPSILQSSDIDGGSSVAVLTYVQCILETLEHPDLTRLILNYLLAKSTKPDPVAGVHRRSSTLNMDLLNFQAEDPNLYNLGDLLHQSLGSKSQQAVTAALSLTSVLLRRHYLHTISTFVRVNMLPETAPRRTIGGHNKEMGLLFSWIEEIGIDEMFNSTFENALKDATTLLEHHPYSSFFKNMPRSLASGVPSSSITNRGAPSGVSFHTLNPHDMLLQNLTSLVQTFLTNAIPTNLSLTGTILDLASCGQTRLEGWLLVDPAKYSFPDSTSDVGSDESGYQSNDDDEDLELDLVANATSTPHSPFASLEAEQSKGLRNAQREPTYPPSALPPLLAAIQSLVAQYAHYRSEIKDLDSLFAERKQEFRLGDELDDAITSDGLLHPKGTGSKGEGRSSVEIFGGSSRSEDGKGTSWTPQKPAKSEGKRPGMGTRSTSTRILVWGDGEDDYEGEEGGRKTSSDGDEKAKSGKMSLSHLLTNVVILQEFITELAALVQVRAGMFPDVAFS
jgi:Retinoic acid induced 16-like protein